MPVLYHITPRVCVDSILLQGLLPNQGGAPGMCSGAAQLWFDADKVRKSHPRLKKIETRSDGTVRPIWLGESFEVIFGFTGSYWIRDNDAVLFEVDVDGLQIVLHRHPFLGFAESFVGEYMAFSPIEPSRLKIIDQPRLPRGFVNGGTASADYNSLVDRARKVLGSAYCP